MSKENLNAVIQEYLFSTKLDTTIVYIAIMALFTTPAHNKWPEITFLTYLNEVVCGFLVVILLFRTTRMVITFLDKIGLIPGKKD